MQRRELFWNSPPPVGIRAVVLQEIIDLDECKICFQTANRGFEKSYIGARVKESVPYGYDEQ